MLGLLCLGFTGCAIVAPNTGRLGLRLPPAALGATINLQQHLTVQRGGRIDELDAALEIDPERIDLVGLHWASGFCRFTTMAKRCSPGAIR